jgi:hypothetical protein
VDDVKELIEVYGPSRTAAFALARLERFAGLVSDPCVQEIPAWRHLARCAALSAFTDCRRLGLHDEALRVIRSACGEHRRGA